MVCYHCKDRIEGTPVLTLEWGDNPFCSWECVARANERMPQWAILNGCEVYLE